MVRFVCLFTVLLGLVFFASPAQAKRVNLLSNGSFEQGDSNWAIFGKYRFVQGYCSDKALQMDGEAFSDDIKVKVGQPYRITFRYTRWQDAEEKTPKQWTRYVYDFTAGSKWISAWFYGAGTIDCVRIVRLNSVPNPTVAERSLRIAIP